MDSYFWLGAEGRDKSNLDRQRVEDKRDLLDAIFRHSVYHPRMWREDLLDAFAEVSNGQAQG